MVQNMLTQPFHLMIKPAGPICNLACEYCYYLEKTELYPNSKCRMDLETLERVVAAYLQAHPGPEVVFGWQGGEPLLMGRPFFEKALEFQAKYVRPGQQVQNALQTNATLIDDAWAKFFADNGFLIGVSMDGPADLHDKYRRSPTGKATHARVVAGLEHLKKHKADFNALVTVNRFNSRHPLKVYKYLTGLGFDFLQFIPIVERVSRDSLEPTPWSVQAEQYGKFLCEIFDYWARNDVGRIFVQLFESALNVWMGGYPSLCVFAPVCGRALAVEHNGDLYACDHFVYADHFRGNIADAKSLKDMVDGTEQQEFGLVKAKTSSECLECEVLPFCGGDCPKHWLATAEDGKLISHLCAGYKQFFTHSAPVFRAMASELFAGRPATNVMHALQQGQL